MNFHLKVFMVLLSLMVLAWFGYLIGVVSALAPAFIHVCQAVDLLGYMASRDNR